jgi:hypothetical protein
VCVCVCVCACVRACVCVFFLTFFRVTKSKRILKVWDILPRSSAGKFCLHLQDRKIKRMRKQHEKQVINRRGFHRATRRYDQQNKTFQRLRLLELQIAIKGVYLTTWAVRYKAILCLIKHHVFKKFHIIWVINFTPWPLHCWRKFPVLIDTKLRGPQSRCRRCEEKIPFPYPRTR